MDKLKIAKKYLLAGAKEAISYKSDRADITLAEVEWDDCDIKLFLSQTIAFLEWNRQKREFVLAYGDIVSFVYEVNTLKEKDYEYRVSAVVVNKLERDGNYKDSVEETVLIRMIDCETTKELEIYNFVNRQ